jgi:hypothetical protein
LHHFIPQSYNYFDYQKQLGTKHFSSRAIDTNMHVFYFFDKVHEIQSLPLWFDSWWNLFGAETSIMPPPLVQKFTEYSKNNPPST